MPDPAIVLANGHFRGTNGKTAHGLVRGSERFDVRAVVDPDCAGADAGELLDGVPRGIPVVADLDAALRVAGPGVSHCVVGVATHGGRLTPELRGLLLDAIAHGLHLVNGLHDPAGDDPEVAAAAAAAGVRVIDLRRPRPKSELHFWEGDEAGVRAPRLAVLGTDCAVGKRTTTRLLVAALGDAGIRAEMIYTGQTGWMQGARYGVVLDAVVNDYVSGELEHAIVQCDRESAPDVMIIEGQSSLRNPSGPCGAELLLSAGARAVVLQHAPERRFFVGYEEQGYRIPSVESEIELIGLYGARVVALALTEEGATPEQTLAHQQRLAATLRIPVVRPTVDGVDALVPPVMQYLRGEQALCG
jgi:uncharacterized NAD-dependent epimerase/dehydratase family protein